MKISEEVELNLVVVVYVLWVIGMIIAFYFIFSGL